MEGKKYVYRKLLFFDFHVSFSFSQPPPSSSRPPVTGYRISHNITGNNTVNQTSKTDFMFEGVVPGVYFFSVVAVNVLGEGSESSEETVTGQ